MPLPAETDKISSSEIEAALKSSADVMMKISETGKILTCHIGRFADPFWSPDELLGKEVDKTILAQQAVSFTKVVQNVVKEKDARRIEYLVKVPDAEKWFEVRLLPVENQEVLAVFKDITSTKTFEADTQRSRALFQAIFDNTYQFTCLLTPEGKVLEANMATLNFAGFKLSEIQNKFFWELKCWQTPEVNNIKLRAGVRTASAGNFIRYETPVLGGDGKIYMIDFSLKPIIDSSGNVIYIIAEGRDITEKKVTEEKLRLSEEKYRSIAQNIPKGFVLVFNKQCVFTLAEGEGIQSLGLKKEQIEGKNLNELITDPKQFAIAQEICNRAFNGENVQTSWKIKNGNWYNIHVLPLTVKNKVVEECMVVAFDITELKITQQKLQDSISTLKLKNEQLEQFSFISSHDLQEPLRMVATYTQLLAQKYEKLIDEEAKEYIKFAQDGARRIQQLIYDLIVYTDIDNGSKEKIKIKAGQVLSAVLYSLSDEISQSKAQVDYSILPEVVAEPTLFGALLQNLISNAIKFVKPGVTPKIEISAHEENGEWIFSVKDNGIGIKKSHLTRIFQIFTRLNSREEYPGTGMGLAICQKIIEKHNGKIWVESEPDNGSTFYFSLPKKPYITTSENA